VGTSRRGKSSRGRQLDQLRPETWIPRKADPNMPHHPERERAFGAAEHGARGKEIW
jgi:hypothetical protein